MKKVLAVVLVVVVFASLVGTTYADNPADNPFVVQPTVTKLESMDNTLVPLALKRGNSMFNGPNGTVWIVTSGKDQNTHIVQVDNTGKIIQNVVLHGVLSTDDYCVLNRDNYLYIETGERSLNNNYNYLLNCFDLQKGEVVWSREWDDIEWFYMGLALSGLVCGTDKEFMYLDNTGKTVFSLDNSSNMIYLASYSKDNSIFIRSYRDKKILEISLADGKTLNTYDLPTITEGNTTFLCSAPIHVEGDTVLDFSKTDTITYTFYTNDTSSPYYSDKLLVADVHFDGTKFTVDNEATYVPRQADGEFFVWDVLVPANVPFNYILQDTGNYRIFMDSQYHHLLSQNIEIHDKKNNLLWSKMTNSKGNIYNLNAPIIYKDTLIYGDQGNIVFANLSDGTVKYSITLDQPTKRSLFIPIGIFNNDFWYAMETYDVQISFYKITLPASITVNSNIPSAEFTITSGDKSMKWTVGKPLELPVGTYTITMDAPTIDGVKAPDPLQIAIDGSDKTIELDYIDTKAPDVTVDNPVVNGNIATISGTVTDNFSGVKEVDVNGTAVTVSSDGKFTTDLPITNGTLSFTISAIDNAGNETTKTYNYTFTYSITATAGPGGSISPSGAVTVKSGDSATFTITPNSGYAISDVKVDGKSVGVVTSYTFTNVTADHTIEATFEKQSTQTVIVLKIGSSSFTVNGETRYLDSPPVIKNSRTLVPIRAIVEALGGTVGWDATEKKVTVSLGSTTIELWIGKNTARVNGVSKPIDSTNSKVVPEIINGRTMLPLRFVTENLGCTVQWDGSTQTITITYGG
jgi:hypothetical protein